MMPFSRIATYAAALSLTTLVGCASPNSDRSGSSRSAPSSVQLQAILAATPEDVDFLIVPSASNALSNKLTQAALASGSGSTAVDTLYRQLTSGIKTVTGIVGDSPVLNRSTLKATLNKLKGQQTQGRVFIQADATEGAELVTLGETVGVQVVIVQLAK